MSRFRSLRAPAVAAALSVCPAASGGVAMGAESIPAPADVAAVPEDAEIAASGVASRVLAPGTGNTSPGPEDGAVFHYTGWTADGEMFDSSVARDRALRVELDRLVAGLSEALQLMVAGEKRRVWVPPALGYEGQKGKPQGMLVFDLELLAVLRRPPVPVDVAGIPADAEPGKGGMASRILVAGTGTRHPRARDTVEVHYTGWTTDGEMFDSSVFRGPARFRLTDVIRGWTLGLQSMVAGEKRRLWIPEKLAYGGERGKPRGMLVFDVELISIE